VRRHRWPRWLLRLEAQPSRRPCSGVILGIAAVTVLASARGAWAIRIATRTFAIFVVLHGMSITVRGGRIGDVVYHAILLLILMIAGVALLRSAGTSSS